LTDFTTFLNSKRIGDKISSNGDIDFVELLLVSGKVSNDITWQLDDCSFTFLNFTIGFERSSSSVIAFPIGHCSTLGQKIFHKKIQINALTAIHSSVAGILPIELNV